MYLNIVEYHEAVSGEFKVEAMIKTYKTKQME